MNWDNVILVGGRKACCMTKAVWETIHDTQSSMRTNSEPVHQPMSVTYGSERSWERYGLVARVERANIEELAVHFAAREVATMDPLWPMTAHNSAHTLKPESNKLVHTFNFLKLTWNTKTSSAIPNLTSRHVNESEPGYGLKKFLHWCRPIH